MTRGIIFIQHTHGMRLCDILFWLVSDFPGKSIGCVNTLSWGLNFPFISGNWIVYMAVIMPSPYQNMTVLKCVLWITLRIHKVTPQQHNWESPLSMLPEPNVTKNDAVKLQLWHCMLDRGHIYRYKEQWNDGSKLLIFQWINITNVN